MKNIYQYINFILIFAVACTAHKTKQMHKKPKRISQVSLLLTPQKISSKQNNPLENKKYIDVVKIPIEGFSADNNRYIRYLYKKDDKIEKCTVLRSKISPSLLKFINEQNIKKKGYYKNSKDLYGRPEFRAIYDKEFQKNHEYLVELKSSDIFTHSNKIIEYQGDLSLEGSISKDTLYKITNRHTILNLNPEYLDDSVPEMYKRYLAHQKLKKIGVLKCLRFFGTLILLGLVGMLIYSICSNDIDLILYCALSDIIVFPFIIYLLIDPCGYNIKTWIDNRKYYGITEPSDCRKKVCCMKKIDNNVKGSYSCCFEKYNHPECTYRECCKIKF